MLLLIQQLLFMSLSLKRYFAGCYENRGKLISPLQNWKRNMSAKQDFPRQYVFTEYDFDNSKSWHPEQYYLLHYNVECLYHII